MNTLSFRTAAISWIADLQHFRTAVKRHALFGLEWHDKTIHIASFDSMSDVINSIHNDPHSLRAFVLRAPQRKRARQGCSPYLALTPLTDANQLKKLNHVNQF